MKYLKNPIGLLFVIAASIFVLNSCSQDDDISSEQSKQDKDQQETSGRFDNTPFIWDEVYSLNDSKDNVYIGDLSVQVNDGLSATTRSRTSSGGRYNGSSSGSDSSGDDNSVVTDNISVINPTGIYIGAVYPASSLPYKFDREVTKPRNPIDIVFDFSSPFIAEVTKETGSIGYKKALRDAINSSDYKFHVNSDKESVSYSMTQFSSYKDLEKGFSNNTKFGSLFSAQVKINSSKVSTKINGKLFARLTSNNFTTYMDTPSEATGFFKDINANKAPIRGQEANVYIRSITYGKVVYVAIESEYSYSEVKFALETSVKFGSFGSTTSVNNRVTEIFNKSAITIFAISDNSTDSFFVDGIKNLENLFKAKYTNNSYGFPTFIQGRYIHNNASYYPTRGESSSGNSNTRPPSTGRPSYNSGETSRPSTGGRESSRPSTSGRESSRPGGGRGRG